MVTRHFTVGVTGGIGSGKSTICNIFSILGIPIYEADIRAKSLMVDNQNVVNSIKKIFGDQAYLDNGALDRQYLARHVFSDKNHLKDLNDIVHPAVALDFENWCKTQRHVGYVIKEAALLVESGSYKSLDFLITVIAPENVRIARVLKRDPKRTEKQVKQIISNQLNDNEKIPKSKFIINNDGHTLVVPQVLEIHRLLNNHVQTG